MRQRHVAEHSDVFSAERTDGWSRMSPPL